MAVEVENQLHGSGSVRVELLVSLCVRERPLHHNVS